MPQEAVEAARDIEELTLSDLLTLAPADIPDPAVTAGVECEDLQSLKKQLSNLPLPIAWSSVQSKIAEMTSAALNSSVLTLWSKGWEKYQGLLDDAEKSRKSPRAEIFSALAEHTVDSTLHPYLEIYLGPEKFQKIVFDVTLTTKVKGLQLGLKNARIVSLQFAQCEWSGRIGIGDFTLVERDLKKLSLPGKIHLKHGIPLGESA